MTSAAAPNPNSHPTDRGVYGIGVTSDLVGTAIQNLRAYERAGLVMPSRTPGGTRLYSPEDVARLRRIQVLLAQGLNLAGVAQVLDLQDDNQRLREQLAELADDASGADGSAEM
jgi:MerR family transcriptional regulator/heat shock protein HspR